MFSSGPYSGRPHVNVKASKIRSCLSAFVISFNTLNAELNPICHLLALLGVHHFLYVSMIRVKSLTLRLLMSYIYIYIYIYDISSLMVQSLRCSFCTLCVSLKFGGRTNSYINTFQAQCFLRNEVIKHVTLIKYHTNI
jgi:hypothetical protein